ncbi:MAG: acyl-CoA synthetase [Candidatus Tectimicrobiota bacterium]|nr:MAG: acyl-CoA synthetase [Candidatus Tectomicrobia bacterium]
MPQEVNYTPLTPLSFLRRSAYVYPEKTAVVYRDRHYTYREFQQRVNRLATALQGVGVSKGDRVAFLCPNIPPMLEAHFGVPLAGAILVAINIRLSPDEIAYILNHSEAKVLCVDSELAHLIRPIRHQLPHLQTLVNIFDTAHEGLAGIEYEAFLASGSDTPLPKPVEDENEPISINYTSGTTGRPKGVMYTHRGAYLNALGEVLEVGLNHRSTYLWTLPMFHCNGWCFTWGVTAVGATHVCLRRVDPEEVFRLIEAEKVSHLCGAPTVLISLVNHPRAKTAKFPRKLHVTTAAAPPSPTIIAAMEALGAEITHVYGLTETYGPHSVCAWHEAWDDLPAEERARKKARQGVPYIVAEEMRVVDEQMQDVPADAATLGEVIMRGNNVMKGYFRQPEATAEAFRGGWFHSGDLAVVHPDGYIELRDRKKDIIISGGENISTIEVENTIYQHPAVQEVAVIAIPDEKWGEVPKAFVTLKPGMQATAEEIIQFCRERLAHFKCPKAVEFGELPKTSTGKIKKFELREREWQGYDKRIH